MSIKIRKMENFFEWTFSLAFVDFETFWPEI